MAEIDDVRQQIRDAAARGDEQAVTQLSTRYRDLQAQAGQLAPIGRFRAQTGREYQLATRAVQLRRAGRDQDATTLIRTIARERVARQHSQRQAGFDPQAFGLGLNRALFNVGSIGTAAVQELADRATGDRDPRDFRQRLEDQALTEQAIREQSPISAGAGEVTGIVATLPAAGAVGRTAAAAATRAAPRVAARLAPVATRNAIGAAARTAQIAERGGRTGMVLRGGARAAIAGGAAVAPYAASDSFVRNESLPEAAGNVATQVAVGGALAVPLRAVAEVAGPSIARAVADFGDSDTATGIARLFGRQANDIQQTLTARLGRAPTRAEVVQERNARAVMRRIADQSDEAASEIVARYNEFRIRNNAEPSAVEIVSHRTGRNVSRTVSGHGEAAESSINLSEQTQKERPGQIARAIENGSPRTTSVEVEAQTRETFTGTMRRVGDHTVNVPDDELQLLAHPSARTVYTDPKGNLTDVGRRIQDGLAQREAAKAARAEATDAQNNAQQLAQRLAQERSRIPTIRSARDRVRAKQQLPALERQVRVAQDRARDAAARATAAAREVKPVQLTIRDIESIRTGVRDSAEAGARYENYDLSDRIRDIARNNGGKPGQEYFNGLREFSKGMARSEGIAAGRSVASSAADESVATARGVGASPVQQADVRGGAREGVRSGLAERAGQGPVGYRQTTEALAQNENLGQALEQTVGPQEAARLRGIGETNVSAAQRLEAATPSRAEAVAEEAARQNRLLLSAVAVAQGSTGGAFRVNLADKLISHFSISRQAAMQLVDLAFNPKRVGEFVTLMARFSGNANRLRENMDFFVAQLPAAMQRAYGDARLSQDNRQASGPLKGEDATKAVPQGDQAAADTGDVRPVSFNDVSPAYLERLAQIESSGNPSARARTSTAAGLHQFTEGTWLEVLRRHGDELGLGRAARHIRRDGTVDDPAIRRTILDLRHEPEVSNRVAAAMTADNFNSLVESLGREPTEGELYAAHFLGIGGARRLIRAIENGVQNAAEEFPREARANRAIFYDNGTPRSAQEVMDVLDAKWNE